jgi:hypothetical protein
MKIFSIIDILVFHSTVLGGMEIDEWDLKNVV